MSEQKREIRAEVIFINEQAELDTLIRRTDELCAECIADKFRELMLSQEECTEIIAELGEYFANCGDT